MSEVHLSATDSQIKMAQEHVKGLMGEAILSPGNVSTSLESMLAIGAKIRDQLFFKYPVLPGAIFAFQQISAAREWAVGGSPAAVSKSIKFLNTARTLNTVTGLVDVGFESYLKRRVLDYLTVGRTTFSVTKNKDKFGGDLMLEYLDPTILNFTKLETGNRNRWGFFGSAYRNLIRRVRGPDKVWEYLGHMYREDEIFVHHPFPVGSNSFVSPTYWLLPSASLAWLVREHNTAATDGRKIRDILLIGNPALSDKIREALTIQTALWAGANPEEVGIPVIEMQNPSGNPLTNNFATIGLSKIPDSFDEERFMFMYVNEISGALGLTIRHFWNDDRNTNRALEVVQEQRQQQKGPAALIRSEQRLINRPGVLDRVSGSKSTRFAFIEEVDTASMKNTAEVLKLHAEALEKFVKVFGMSISPDSYLAWMKREGAMPLDLILTDRPPPTDETINPEQGLEENTVNTEISDPSAVSIDPEGNLNKSVSTPGNGDLDYGEIWATIDGTILEKRSRVFQVKDILASISKIEEAEEEAETKTLLDTLDGTSPTSETLEQEIEDTFNMASQQRIREFVTEFTYGKISEFSENDDKPPIKKEQWDTITSLCNHRVLLPKDVMKDVEKVEKWIEANKKVDDNGK